jgi:hypothetical protein
MRLSVEQRHEDAACCGEHDHGEKELGHDYPCP